MSSQPIGRQSSRRSSLDEPSPVPVDNFRDAYGPLRRPYDVGQIMCRAERMSSLMERCAQCGGGHTLSVYECYGLQGSGAPVHLLGCTRQRLAAVVITSENQLVVTTLSADDLYAPPCGWTDSQMEAIDELPSHLSDLFCDPYNWVDHSAHSSLPKVTRPDALRRAKVMRGAKATHGTKAADDIAPVPQLEEPAAGRVRPSLLAGFLSWIGQTKTNA